MAINATFVCWHCGTQHAVVIPYPPQYAFELAGWANDCGLYGAIDLHRGRGLVFCNEDHANKEKTKAGRYRVRPAGPKLFEQEGGKT